MSKVTNLKQWKAKKHLDSQETEEVDLDSTIEKNKKNEKRLKKMRKGYNEKTLKRLRIKT